MNKNLPKITRSHHFRLRQAARNAKSLKKPCKFKCSTKKITIEAVTLRIENITLTEKILKNVPRTSQNFLDQQTSQQKPKQHVMTKNQLGMTT